MKQFSVAVLAAEGELTAICSGISPEAPKLPAERAPRALVNVSDWLADPSARVHLTEP